MKRRARREGSHPDDGCGLRRRGPAGRRAGPTPGELAGGRRSKSAFQAVRATLSALVSGSRAMPVRGPHRENWPALRALSALVSRSRAMPVRDRPSKRGAGFGAPARCRSETGDSCRRWFRAPARCRSETGAPSVVGAGFALPRDAGQRPALQATPTGCRNSTPYTKSPPGGGCHGERRLPLPVGFRPILAGVR